MVLLVLCNVWISYLKMPELMFIRTIESLLITLILCAVIFLSSRVGGKRLPYVYSGLAIVLMSFLVFKEGRFQYHCHMALYAPTHEMKAKNAHLILGYGSIEDAKLLAANGIAGLFLTTRNIKGKSFTQLQAELNALQQIRQETDQTPLIIATDQEGGAVSRLASVIGPQPTLASFVDKKNAQQQVREYGFHLGQQLKHIGVNLNFSPVIDLDSQQPIDVLDFHSRIQSRAISANAEVTSVIAQAYIEGLQRAGVTATVKHFPGLAWVNGDTHHFSARLNKPIAELQELDWLPFRAIADNSSAWIMLAHVTLDAIDAEHPVSSSKKVVQGLLREHWQFTGTLVTDDMTMAASFKRGLCSSSEASLEASVDYLLLAYDYQQYYSLIHCLTDSPY